MSNPTLNPFDELDRHHRDELGRHIRYAARLSSFLAGKAHHPDLDELLKELILDIEHLWLLAEEGDEQEVGQS